MYTYVIWWVHLFMYKNLGSIQYHLLKRSNSLATVFSHTRELIRYQSSARPEDSELIFPVREKKQLQKCVIQRKIDTVHTLFSRAKTVVFSLWNIFSKYLYNSLASVHLKNFFMPFNARGRLTSFVHTTNFTHWFFLELRVNSSELSKANYAFKHRSANGAKNF